MTILSRLFERRDVTAADFNRAIFTDPKVESGVSVTQASALTLVPVYACIRLRAETIGSLAVDSFRRKGEDRVPTPRPAWMDQPNPDSTFNEAIERAVSSLDTDGNVFIGITSYDDLGLPREWYVLDPRSVVVERREDGTTQFVVGGSDTYPAWNRFTNRGEQSILHIKAFAQPGSLRGLSPIAQASEAIGLGLAAEKFGARWFGSGSTPSGVIELPGNPNQIVADSIKDNWQKKHGGVKNSHTPGVLFGGATWKPITVSPNEAQFLETRKFQVGEIARLFRVPPHLIGDVDKSTSWGTGIEEQTIGFVVYSLTPTLVRLERAFDLMTVRGNFTKFNVNGLLRGDAKKRWEAYQIALQNGVVTPNEVRHWEDLNSLPGLDKPFVPNANAVPQGDTTDAE